MNNLYVNTCIYGEFNKEYTKKLSFQKPRKNISLNGCISINNNKSTQSRL